MTIEEILKLVKEDLAKRLNIKSINDYDPVSLETAKELLDDDNILIYNEFKDALISPWAIAKYMYLYIEEKELIKQVEEDLKNLSDKIEYCFVKHLSCNVQFNNKFEEGIKKQVLIVKYYLDEDDKIQYKLTNAGNNACWDITKGQLKALLENEIIIPEKVNKLKKKNIFNWIKRKLGL